MTENDGISALKYNGFRLVSYHIKKKLAVVLV